MTGWWGIAVYDLGSGRLSFRRRTAFFARRPAIDARNGLVYVATLAGKLHVFDRETFAPLGTIPVGFGSRHPYVTRDGDHLLTTSEDRHFAFRTDALAATAAGRPPPPRR